MTNNHTTTSIGADAMRPIITWLDNGCDPKQAAEELRLLVQRADALASAAQPAAVPPGYVLIPVEPSDKMVQAALHIDLSYMPGQDGADRAAVYRAMLAAAKAAHTPTAKAAPDPRTPANMRVNSGALRMALNVLRRAGKNEVADELEKTAVQGDAD